MIKCKECTALNAEGSLFCVECGAFVVEMDPNSTAVLPFSDFIHRPPPAPVDRTAVQTAFTVNQLTVVIPGSRRRLMLEAEEEIHVGRSDPDTGHFPELDLTQFEGASKGVSRLHAKITVDELGVSLTDLNSTNGTLLNMYRLPPEEPYPLQDGDEIRFGDLLIHIFFD